MNNFNLHTPTRILFSKGAIAGLREQIPHDARVLTTHGGDSVKKTGVLDQVPDALKGMNALGFGDIEPDPACETLMSVTKLVREQKVTFLLAAGDGSVLDDTRPIAVTANYPENIDPWHILRTGGKKTKSVTPMGCVLTLPAIGSESNTGAVIPRKTIGDRQAFHSTRVQPVFAALNPVYTYTLSPRQVANGVVDALIHTVEQYVIRPVDAKIQDRSTEGILLTLIEDGPKVLREPENYDVHADVMWAVTQALSGLTGAGVPQDWATHMLDHEPTVIYGLDHARTLAIVLPALWSEERDTKRAKLLQYAERVRSITEGSDDERTNAVIATTRNFFEQLGVPAHLSDYGLNGSSISALLKRLEEYGITRPDEDHGTTLDVNRRIHEAARQAFYASNFRLRAFRPGLSSQHLIGACFGKLV